MSLRVVFVVACVLVCALPEARADDAETFKQQGVTAAQQGNWELARDNFARSYQLEPRALTLFNLAVAQSHLGQLLAARASYQQFLASASNEAPKWSKLAADALAQLGKDIPKLHVRAAGFPANVTLEPRRQARRAGRRPRGRPGGASHRAASR